VTLSISVPFKSVGSQANVAPLDAPLSIRNRRSAIAHVSTPSPTRDELIVDLCLAMPIGAVRLQPDCPTHVILPLVVQGSSARLENPSCRPGGCFLINEHWGELPSPLQFEVEAALELVCDNGIPKWKDPAGALSRSAQRLRRDDGAGLRARCPYAIALDA